MQDFSRRLVAWQRRHGRHDLPWQGTRDPYLVWLSEIMLQQTQVASVVPYFERFRARFPDVASLAAADEDEVLALWAGLGYYSRARNLHRAARLLVSEHGGHFPETRAALESLPGVGRSTAAAIAAFAFGRREAILDGNVKRVLARHFALPGFPGEPRVARRLWTLAESLAPARGIERYTQALMDLGATVCTTRAPACGRCPVSRSCEAFRRGAPEAFPAPRPRREIPRRRTVMLVLLHGGDVLLEKRPPTGVWGGLWCFPEAPSVAGAKAIAARLGCKVGRTATLPPVTHGFTHFTLEIAPLLAMSAKRDPRAGEPGTMWVPLDDAGAGAVPAAVRKILALVARQGERGGSRRARSRAREARGAAGS
ncbi:MAG: A/G-specific adenine glycosylase [Burkholderiales bacterium]|nr:A/G-specific adenine glycosylase [Burkholderiales bacterium]